MKPAFETIVSEHSGRIRTVAKRYATEDSCADDLFQDIVEQLWKSYSSFREDSSIETWIYRVAFNTAMTGLTKTIKNRQGHQAMHQLSLEQVMTGDRSQADILEEFITTLNDIDTSILMMYLDGLSGKQMSDVLGISTNAVQIRINRVKVAFTERYVEGE